MPENFWKKPAAGTSRWWRNNALLPDHIRRLHHGRDGRARPARRAFPQTIALYFSGHGMATQTSATNREQFFYQRFVLANVRAGHHFTERPVGNARRTSLRIRTRPG